MYDVLSVRSRDMGEKLDKRPCTILDTTNPQEHLAVATIISRIITTITRTNSVLNECTSVKPTVNLLILILSKYVSWLIAGARCSIISLVGSL
jgi:hypothetical protein